tara:strand:+ start:225 stop:644 length:420 start_codon:yes stop_codon:yes gene_type:complete
VHKGIITSLILSALAGVIYFVLLGYIWTYIALYNPIANWLTVNFPQSEWLYPLLYLHDSLINLVLAFPLALLIYSLRPKHYFLYIAVALVPSVALNHRFWVFDAELNREWLQMVPGLATELFCVPVVLIIICWFKRNCT